MFIYDIAPCAASSPYHYEYTEEWLLVVDGTVTVRTPDGEQTLERGALARFPAGPDGAHKIMNRSDAPARALLFSSARAPAVSVYPDSNKTASGPATRPTASSSSATPPCPGHTARRAGTGRTEPA
jgi:uncharacterized cupin superfamily protein